MMNVKLREDIASEVVCNTIGSLTEQLSSEKYSLTEQQIARLRFNLEKEIRVALKGANYNGPAKVGFNIFAD